MTPVVGPIFALLASDTGNLAYQLVLTFALFGVLQVATGLLRIGDIFQLRRLILGISILLGIRLALFVAAGLAWQRLIDGAVLLPYFDLASMLISLVVISWLWAFPDPSSSADAATIMVGLLLLTVVLFGYLWWTEPGNGQAFNRSLPDLVGSITAVGIVSVGLLLLLFRRPTGWIYGVIMLCLILTGFLVSLLTVLTGGADYHGFIRLTWLAAVPFLFLLPQRSLAPALQPGAPQLLEQDKGLNPKDSARPGLDPRDFQPLLKSSPEKAVDQYYPQITSTFARYSSADVCLLILSPEGDGKLRLQNGYDRTHQQYLVNTTLDEQGFPKLTSAFHQRRLLRLSANSTAPELVNLAKIYSQIEIGQLLFLPASSLDDELDFGVVLLFSSAERSWTADDQSSWIALRAVLAYILQRTRKVALLEQAILDTRQELEFSKDRLGQSEEERQRLLDLIAVLQQNADRDRQQLESLAAMVTNQDTNMDLAVKLQAEIDQLRRASQTQMRFRAAEERQTSEGELYLALQEIAFLRMALAKSDQPATGTKRDSDGKQFGAKEVDLIELIDEAVDTTNAQLRKKHIALSVDVPRRLPMIKGDRKTVKAILVSLLESAVVVTPDEGEITLRASKVRDESNQESVQLQIAEEIVLWPIAAYNSADSRSPNGGREGDHA